MKHDNHKTQRNDKCRIVQIGVPELEVFYALTTGDDKRVPQQLREQVCLSVHDHVLPEMPMSPAQRHADGSVQNWLSVVDMARSIKPDKVLRVLTRWIWALVHEAQRAESDPRLN